MKAWKAILAALVIFCAGAGTGVLSAKLWLLAPAAQPAKPIRPPDFSAPQRLKEALHTLDRQLKLSTDQWGRIEKVLRESQDRTKKLWQDIDPQVKDNIKQTKLRIRDLLSADQKVLFDELCSQPFRGRRRTDEPAGRSQQWERRRGSPPGRAPQNLNPPLETTSPGMATNMP